MSTTAQGFLEKTSVVAIGVSDYDSTGIRHLPSSSAAAEKLAAAFISTGVPESLVTVASDKISTQHDAIRSLISSAARRVPPDGILILFFSGHGEASETAAHVFASDSLPLNPDTMLSADELGRLLEGNQASGLLVLIDTCDGAGISEHAPSFFRKLGKGNFRIVLSSSRADEPSHQPADGSLSPFCDHLCRLIRGESRIGGSTGEVRLGDLVEHLQSAVDEEAQARGLPQQQVIFAGVHGPDPLLFLQATADKSIKVDETRYTWRYVRRQLRTYGLFAVAAAFFLVALWYVVLDSTQYIELARDARTLVVERGYPGLNGLPGYPRLIWEFEDSFQELPALNQTLRGKFGSHVISDLGRPVMDKVMQALDVRQRATLYGEMGQRERARQEILKLKNVAPIEEAIKQGLNLIAKYGTDEDIDLLRKLQDAGDTTGRMVLARHDDQLLESLEAVDKQNSMSGLSLNILDPPCSKGATRYINAFFAKPSQNMNDIGLVLDGATRLRCVPGPEQVRSLMDLVAANPGNQDFAQMVGYYLAVVGGQDWSLVVSDWAKGAPTRADSALLVLRWLSQPCVALQSLVPTAEFGQRLAEQILASCPPGTPKASASPTLVPEAIVAAKRNGALTSEEATSRLLSLILASNAPLLNMNSATDGLQAVNDPKLSSTLISAIVDARGTQLTGFQVAAIVRLLWKVDPAAAATAIPRINFLEPAVMMSEQFRATSDPRGMAKEILDRFGEPSAQQKIGLLMGIPLSAEELDRVRRFWRDGNPTERGLALAVLSAQAPPAEVARLILSPSAQVRSSATAFAIANPQYDAILDAAVAQSRFPNFSLMLALSLQKFRQGFLRDVSDIPTNLQLWRRGLIGLRLPLVFPSPPYRPEGVLFLLNNYDPKATTH